MHRDGQQAALVLSAHEFPQCEASWQLIHPHHDHECASPGYNKTPITDSNSYATEHIHAASAESLKIYMKSIKCVTCVGISRGALLSMEGQVAVSPFKYANNSLRSGRRTAGILAAC